MSAGGPDWSGSRASGNGPAPRKQLRIAAANRPPTPLGIGDDRAAHPVHEDERWREHCFLDAGRRTRPGLHARCSLQPYPAGMAHAGMPFMVRASSARPDACSLRPKGWRSVRPASPVSIEAFQSDLEAVVDRLGLSRFALLALHDSGPVAVLPPSPERSPSPPVGLVPRVSQYITRPDAPGACVP
jgi:hypothetical protein